MDISNQRIKDWRAVLGISIEEFSKATGIPVDRIKKIEKGAVKVNVDEITKIADTYDLTIDYLIGKRNIPLPPARTEKEARMWSQIEALSEMGLLELMLKLRVNLDDEEVLDGKGSVKVICYGKEEVWESREEALNFYLKAIAGSEGSEKERYSNIFLELCAGLKVCTDTVEKEE